MWEVTELWNLISDFHSIEWDFVKHFELVQFEADNIGVELGNITSWTVILDDLDHEMVGFFVIQNFSFKYFGVKKLHFGVLAPVLRCIVILKFIVHVILDELTEFLLWLIPIFNEGLVFFHVAIVILDAQFFIVALT